MTKNMKDIVGIDVDYNNIPDDWQISTHENAVNYRVALARASNAIEGVILSEKDTDFMNAIPAEMPADEFMKLAVRHIKMER